MVDLATLVLESDPEGRDRDRRAHDGGRRRELHHGRRRRDARADRCDAFSVRKEVKDHGAGGRIAGRAQPGDRVVITEDTVTRGTSLLEAAHVVQAATAPRWS